MVSGIHIEMWECIVERICMEEGVVVNLNLFLLSMVYCLLPLMQGRIDVCSFMSLLPETCFRCDSGGVLSDHNNTNQQSAPQTNQTKEQYHTPAIQHCDLYVSWYQHCSNNIHASSNTN